MEGAAAAVVIIYKTMLARAGLSGVAQIWMLSVQI